MSLNPVVYRVDPPPELIYCTTVHPPTLNTVNHVQSPQSGMYRSLIRILMGLHNHVLRITS